MKIHLLSSRPQPLLPFVFSVPNYSVFGCRVHLCRQLQTLASWLASWDVKSPLLRILLPLNRTQLRGTSHWETPETQQDHHFSGTLLFCVVVQLILSAHNKTLTLAASCWQQAYTHVDGLSVLPFLYLHGCGQLRCMTILLLEICCCHKGAAPANTQYHFPFPPPPN